MIYFAPLDDIGFIGPAMSVWMIELFNDGVDRSVFVPTECAGCAWLLDRAQSMQKKEPLSVSEMVK